MLGEEELAETLKAKGVHGTLESGVRPGHILDNQLAGAWSAVFQAWEDLNFMVQAFEDTMYRKGYDVG